MEDLKNAWKQTAKSLIILATDLGVSLFKTAKYGVDAAVEWAKKDNPHVETDAEEVEVDEPVGAPVEEPAETKTEENE